jgi:dipeptidase E
VCFLPTASGDADHYVVRFYRRFSPGCEASHVSLFRRDQGTGGVEDDLASHLLAQDLIYVGGGNVRQHARRLARARARRDPAQGLAQGRRPVRALRRLAVLVRRGAQRLPRRAPPVRGLGLLPYSNCVHYDAEPARRAEYHRFVGDGMRAGFAVEDGVALHFRGTSLERAVSSRPDGAPTSSSRPPATASRDALEVTYLGTAKRPTPARRQLLPRRREAVPREPPPALG